MSPSADRAGLAFTGRALPNRSRHWRTEGDSSRINFIIFVRAPGKIDRRDWHRVPRSVGTLSGLLSRHHHGIGSVKRFVCRAKPRCRNKSPRVPRSAVILAPGESGSRQVLDKMRWEVMQRRISATRLHRNFCLRRFRQTQAAFLMGRISSSSR